MFRQLHHISDTTGELLGGTSMGYSENSANQQPESADHQDDEDVP
jgi:hypothetical protein